MRNRLISTTAVVIMAAAAAAGCAEQTGAAATPQHTAEITVNNTTRTGHVSCSQIQWLLTINATADQSQARAMLHLAGDKVSVRSVNLENFDGFYGVTGKGTGHAEASFANGAYTITGDAAGTQSDSPADPKTVHFRIKARC